MVPYVKQFRFRRKDFLASGDPDKLITGAELASEFKAIARALNSHTVGTYTIITNFAPKDTLPHLAPLKIVDGNELEAEFTAVRTAIIALGGTYTRVYNFTTLHNADAEILGLHFEAEFGAIEDAIFAIRFIENSGIAISDHAIQATGLFDVVNLDVTFNDEGTLELECDVDGVMTLDGDILPTNDEFVDDEWADLATWTLKGHVADDFEIKVSYAQDAGDLTSSATSGSQTFGSFVSAASDIRWGRKVNGFDTQFERSTWTVVVRDAVHHITCATKEFEVTLVVDDPDHPIPDGDPFFDNVVLLIHGGGTDGGTGFADSSNSAHTVTAHGDIEFSSFTSQFPGTSIKFGSGTTPVGYLTVPASSDFDLANDDWTIEMWAYFDQTTFGNNTLFRILDGVNTDLWAVVNSSNALGLTTTNIGGLSSGNSFMDEDNWHHIAYTRESNVAKLWVDGVLIDTEANAGTLNGDGAFVIGSFVSGSLTFGWPGYMEEIRITKGICRYTATFTPPTNRFEDF